MNSSFSEFFGGYLLERLFIRITDFIHHWYVDGSYRFLDIAKTMHKNLEQTLALKATYFHIEEPLYGDYSYSGRAVGFIFRMTRIILGLCIYLALGLIGGVFYLVWVALPIYLLVRVVI
jgi:hypothetical protein